MYNFNKERGERGEEGRRRRGGAISVKIWRT